MVALPPVIARATPSVDVDDTLTMTMGDVSTALFESVTLAVRLRALFTAVGVQL